MRRLERNEKEVIRNSFSNNPLYKAIFAPCKKWEKKMAVFRISAEEVFLESISIIDDLKECKTAKEACDKVDGLWDTLFCEIRDWANESVSDQELEMATCEVMTAVVVGLNYCENKDVASLLIRLVSQCVDETNLYYTIQAEYMENIWKHGEEELKSYMNEYWGSDEYLSDHIRDQLPSIGQIGDGDSNKNTKSSSEEQLTIKQLAILFQHLLNVPFDSSTNISALAKLIAKASGYSVGSVRQQINNLKGIDYSDKNVATDVEAITTLLMGISDNVKKKIAEPLLKMSRIK